MICMYAKTIKLILLFSGTGIIHVSAQQTNVRVYNYNDLITTVNSYFDKKSYNPSYTGDTLALKATLKKSAYWLTTDPDGRNFSGLSVERFTEKLNSGVGLSYDYNLNALKSHILKINYNYRFSIGRVNFRLATSLGINHYTLNTDSDNSFYYINTSEQWNNHPLFSFGTLINYKKHELGITYSDILNFDISPNSSSASVIFKDYFVTNYSYQFQLAKSIVLVPEFINYWDFDFHFWILKSSVSFKNRIYTGLFMRSDDEFGYMVGGKPWKWLTIGYVDTRKGFSYSDYQDTYQNLILTVSF